MNKCSIYICGSVNQTGLGAISTCMLLGKKIYIADCIIELNTE